MPDAATARRASERSAKAPDPARTHRSRPVGGRYLRARRVLDICVVIAATPAALVLIAVAALAMQLVAPGPLLFRQWRGGYRGRDFVMIKLRTMPHTAAGTRVSDGTETMTSADDPRVGRVARWIRRHRIDEVPQLWHVLTGDMALIGPRPIPAGVVRTMTAVTPDYVRRSDVRPGLTGLAQVRIDYNDDIRGELLKLEYDLYYRDNVSPLLDLHILGATVRVVLRGTGGR